MHATAAATAAAAAAAAVVVGHRHRRTNARVSTVDRSWTKSGGRLYYHGRGFCLGGELAQVLHYPELSRSG